MTTHRLQDGSGTFFLHEAVIAFIAACFCRFTVKSHMHESLHTRVLFAIILGGLAYSRQPYDIQFAFQIFSYIGPKLFYEQAKTSSNQGLRNKVIFFIKFASSSYLPLLFCRMVSSPTVFAIITEKMIPSVCKNIFFYLFPITDLRNAYIIITKFTKKGDMDAQLAHLLFVTWNIQIGIGYLGIGFLRAEQMRKNQLVRLEIVSENTESETNKSEKISKGDKKKEILLEKERQFRRNAAPFILYRVIPYMIQIIILGNINRYSFACFRDEIHRSVRLTELFDHDSYLVAMSADSAVSPGGKFSIYFYKNILFLPHLVDTIFLIMCLFLYYFSLCGFYRGGSEHILRYRQ